MNIRVYGRILLSLVPAVLFASASLGCAPEDEDAPAVDSVENESLVVFPSVDDFSRSYLAEDNRSVILKKQLGQRDLLLICLDPVHTRPMPSADRVTAVGTGVQRWFNESSQGRFRIGNVFVRGCGGSTGTYLATPARRGTWYWGQPQEFYNDAVRAADPNFNYAAYDFNGDRRIDGTELAVAVIRPQPDDNWGDWGQAGHATTISADGMSSIAMVDTFFVSAWSDLGKIGLIAHEMNHQMFGAADMYDNIPSWGLPDLPYDADSWSIMDANGLATHLDPFHKLKYGWLNPTLMTIKDQTLWLPDVETTGQVAILHDPYRGTKEYFIVENRVGGSSFDAPLGRAVLVWHIIEDHNLARTYASQSFPFGWGRYAIRQFAIPPLQVDSGSGGAWLRWADGTDSRFRVRVTGTSGNYASIDVEHPAQVGQQWNLTQGEFKTFGPYWVPAGSSFKVNMFGYNAGDADLFCRRADWPTRTVYDAASTSFTSTENCLIDNGGGAYYYVGVYGYSGNPTIGFYVHY